MHLQPDGAGVLASPEPSASPGPPPAPPPSASSLLSWIPLLAGLASTYGPIALNYGIALYFLNYRHGFVKRGLVGELIAPIPHLSRGGLIALQLAFILAAFALTYLVLHPLLFGDPQARLLAAVLLSAPALLPHIGVLFAQPDVTLYILLLLALWAFLRLPPIPAAFASTALACLGLLAHEAFSLAFYPLLVAILFDLCRRKRLPWLIAALQVALTAAAFLAILHFGKLKVSPDLILADAAARTPVPLQRQVFDVMASTFADQRALVRHFYSFPDLQILLAITALLSIPYFALLLSLLRRSAHARAAHQPARRLDLTVQLLLFALPLSLCYLGHDVSRWIAASAIDATLFLCFLALTDPAARTSLRSWAEGPRPFLWLAWFLIAGPYGATGLHLAEHLSVLWTGP
jgi:hypothetical protein